MRAKRAMQFCGSVSCCVFCFLFSITNLTVVYCSIFSSVHQFIHLGELQLRVGYKGESLQQKCLIIKMN